MKKFVLPILTVFILLPSVALGSSHSRAVSVQKKHRHHKHILTIKFEEPVGVPCISIGKVGRDQCELAEIIEERIY